MGTEDELLMIADGGERLLDRDDVPNENQSLTCFSCNAAMVGLFCHDCGNKNDNYRRSVWSLAVELFTNLTAMDNRMWRSLWSLIRRPGRMAREFADGARARWTSPVRFYLATSFLLFGYIALSGTQLIALEQGVTAASEAEAQEPFTRPRFFMRSANLGTSDIIVDNDAMAAFYRGLVEGAAETDVAEILEGELEALEDRLEDLPEGVARERLLRRRSELQEALRRFSPDTEADATPPGVSEGRAAEPGSSGNDMKIQLGNGEVLDLEEEDFGAIYQRILRNPQVINRDLNNRLKLTMFFMLPFAMLLGAVFIRGRRNALLYDHLVHAAYVHGFSFLLLLGFILLHQHTPLSGLFKVYLLILLIYLPLSAKGMFGRGWFKSFLTAYGVGAVYSFIVLTAGTTFVAIGLSEIARDMQSATERSAAPATPEGRTDAPEAQDDSQNDAPDLP